MSAVVINIEASIELADINSVEGFQDNVAEAIEILRQHGAAHVISAVTVDKDPFEDYAAWSKRTVSEHDTRIPQEATYVLEFGR